jgi:broad specificity phosphatase PhoE
MSGTGEPQIGRLIWVRHGESEGNRDRRFTHSPDVPLTDAGREQARVAARRIASRFAPALVIASPFARARETADIIAAVLGLPLQIDPDIREQSLGRFAGLPYESVLGDPDFDPARRWEWRPAEGEALVDVQSRVGRALDRFARAHAGREVVVVAHAGVMQAVWASVTGSWHDAPRTPNTGILVVEHEAGCYRHGQRFEEE